MKRSSSENLIQSSSDDLEATHKENACESVSQPYNKSEQQRDGMSTAYSDDEELYEDNNNVFKDNSEEDCPDYINVHVEPEYETYEETEDRTKPIPPTPPPAVNNPQVIPRQPPRPVPRARNPASVKSEVSITNNNEQTIASKNQQSSNHATQQQVPPPPASKPLKPKLPQRSPETSLSIAGDSLEEGPKWDSQAYHLEVVPQSSGYIGTPGSNTLEEEYDTPPPMPPKQLHTRRSADMSTGDAKEAVAAYLENDKAGKIEDAVPKKMKLPSIPHSATESFQPPAASISSRNDLPRHNQNTREPQVAGRKPPPPVAKRTNKPNKLPTPTKSNSKPQNNPDVTSTEPALTNVRNLKHQISLKLKEERERKEQNNNEQQSEPSSQVSGPPVATPRSNPPNKPLPEPKHRGSPIPGGIPIFGGVPIAGGVSIFPAMPPNIPTQRLPTARPSPQVAPQQLDGTQKSPLPQLPPARMPISPQGPPKLPPSALTRPSRPAPGLPPGSLPPPQPPPKSTAALSGFSSEEE